MTATQIIAHEASLDEWVHFIGGIYLKVNKAMEPIDLWMQVINDGSILAENIRRGELDTAEKRVVKLFGWICSFVGKYLHSPEPIEPVDDPIKGLLRRKVEDFTSLDESYAKWILKKYPCVCAKCGEERCHCSVYRKEIEQRIEKPEPFRELEEKFQRRLQEARQKYVALKAGVPAEDARKFLQQPIDKLINGFRLCSGSFRPPVTRTSRARD